MNEIDLGYNLEIETVQEAMDDHSLGDNNNQERDMNLNQQIEIDQILYSLLQPTQPTLQTQPTQPTQPLKRRAPKCCTICGLENHPQCKRPSGGSCNTPLDEQVPYRKSRGNRSERRRLGLEK